MKTKIQNDFKYTVYMHISPSNKRYIGITGQSVNERWRKGNGYKTQKYFRRAIDKYEWKNFQHIIVAEGLTVSEAGKMERELISKYQTTNPDFGYNESIGGENSPIGVIRSQETKEKLSLAHKGQQSWVKGKHLSNETKEKLRQANLGKKLSEETKKKISEKNKGIKPSKQTIQRVIEVCSKPVIQLSTQKVFDSATEASKSTGEHRNTITRHCRNEVIKKRWAFVNQS